MTLCELGRWLGQHWIEACGAIASIVAAWGVVEERLKRRAFPEIEVDAWRSSGEDFIRVRLTVEKPQRGELVIDEIRSRGCEFAPFTNIGEDYDPIEAVGEFTTIFRPDFRFTRKSIPHSERSFCSFAMRSRSAAKRSASWRSCQSLKRKDIIVRMRLTSPKPRRKTLKMPISTTN